MKKNNDEENKYWKKDEKKKWSNSTEKGKTKQRILNPYSFEKYTLLTIPLSEMLIAVDNYPDLK